MKSVTLIPGDGIGPEVADVVVRVLGEAGAPITWERCVAGEKVFAFMPGELLCEVHLPGSAVRRVRRFLLAAA